MFNQKSKLSSHTIIGSLLEAHPQIVISNELNIFERWEEWIKAEKTRENLINKVFENSHTQSQGSEGFRSAAKNHGRTYAVPNQWQGDYKDYITVSCSTGKMYIFRCLWDIVMGDIK